MSEIQRTAKVSECGRYRYALTRTWRPGTPEALFVMLNPSVADGLRDDPTVRKCVGFAQRWGLGGMRIVNLFAWRATDPQDLHRSRRGGEDIVGPQNTEHLLAAALDASRIVVAWGAHAARYTEHACEVASALASLQPLWCLGLSADGHPRHPLMLAYSTPLERYHSAERKTA